MDLEHSSDVDVLQQWSVRIQSQMTMANVNFVIDGAHINTVSPTGMFSSWHIDQTWCGTVLIALDYLKLFVMCPSTSGDLEICDKIDEFIHRTSPSKCSQNSNNYPTLSL